MDTAPDVKSIAAPHQLRRPRERRFARTVDLVRDEEAGTDVDQLLLDVPARPALPRAAATRAARAPRGRTARGGPPAAGLHAHGCRSRSPRPMARLSGTVRRRDPRPRPPQA